MYSQLVEAWAWFIFHPFFRTAPENLYEEFSSFSITDVSCLLVENLIFVF